MALAVLVSAEWLAPVPKPKIKNRNAMTVARYLRRSLAHHRFAYLGVFAGAVLGAAVLLGALFAGDSVERSLRDIGENRTGRATHVLLAGDRFFRETLA